MTKVIAATLAVILLAIPAMAVSKITAEIPFDFHAGDTKLPAGHYVFEASNSLAIQLMNTATRKMIFVSAPIPVGGGSPVRTSKVVFNKYGSDYFLAETWWAEKSTGRATEKTSLEIELARRMAPVRVESASARR